LTPRTGPCYPERVRALPSSISRAAVAVVLLALFAAPLARATAALGARPHSCCPEAPAQRDPAPPCQQMAPLSCCLEIGVPPAPGAPDRPDSTEFALLAAPAPEPFAPALRSSAALRSDAAPPLTTLAQTCVLLL
jgi:hypothetical protein